MILLYAVNIDIYVCNNSFILENKGFYELAFSAMPEGINGIGPSSDARANWISLLSGAILNANFIRRGCFRWRFRGVVGGT